MYKVDNLDKIDQFLEEHKLPQFIQYEINNLNSPISVKEIVFMGTNHSITNNPGADGYTGESYQTLKEEIKPILPKVFQKLEEWETLPNSFFKANNDSDPQTQQRHYKKSKLQTNIPTD